MPICLSFDDGPGPSTPLLLDVLHAASCRATFFLLGRNLAGALDVAARMAREGHRLGNHTRSHAKPGTLSDDALIDELGRDHIAYVPFFPLGGFSPLQSATLSDVAARLGTSPNQVALAWLLHRAPNVLLIPGTASISHLKENLAAETLLLPCDIVVELDGMAR